MDINILPEKDAEIERLCPKLEPGTGAWSGVVVPLAHSLGISEDSSDNVKRGDTMDLMSHVVL